MMKKEPKYVLLFFSILLGIFISVQFKGKIEMYVPATLSSMQETKLEIDIINNEIEELEKVINEREKEVEKLESFIDKNDEDIIASMEEELIKNKILSGTISLEGPGITIFMSDNDEKRNLDGIYDVTDDIIHDIDIFNIVNDLRIAGAEAISINNQRVIASSKILCAGPTISINERRTGSPFVIKAIGDPQSLIASVNAPGTYGYTLKNGFNIKFDIDRKDNITIQEYDRRSNFKYAKPKGEGD